MATRIVLIHGRSQQGKDAQALKDFWIASLRKGMQKSNLELPVGTDIKFPYYGQSLFDRVSGTPESQIAQIIIKGPAASPAERNFMNDVLREVAKVTGISQAEIDAVADTAVTEKGIQNWESVQRILVALDRHVPKASRISIALATHDVYEYLFNPAVTGPIDAGVSAAMMRDVPTVVVSHSLGTVVAYKMLKEVAPAAGWKVPLFVTLGSPLAIKAIRQRLQPLVHPTCVAKWFNAMDPRDVVSLYPLDRDNFRIDPEVENKMDVDNFTDNRHSIEGYLEDGEVARQIAAAAAAG